MVRHKELYGAVREKRRRLRAAGEFSSPDEAGSKVAILVPFIPEVVLDSRDSRESFEQQTAEVTEIYAERDRKPFHIMDAKREDFARVLGDISVPTVVVAGFGNISAIAVPVPEEGDQPAGYGYLDWLHLAGMATHLKLGKFVMLQCGGFYRAFNPPLPSGVVNSHTNILGSPGRGRVAANGMRVDPPEQITAVDELTYDQIRLMFQMQRRRDIGLILPDAAYAAARDVYNQQFNPDRDAIPQPVKIPHPDFREYHSK